MRYFIGLLEMGCFILGNENLRFNSQELLWWLPLKFYDITFSWYQEKVVRKSYIFPRSVSSYSVPTGVIIIHNSNKVQMYMHIYWNRLLQLFFFSCPEEWLRPLLRQDKQVLVHWWYYPDRCVLTVKSSCNASVQWKWRPIAWG